MYDLPYRRQVAGRRANNDSPILTEQPTPHFKRFNGESKRVSSLYRDRTRPYRHPPAIIHHPQRADAGATRCAWTCYAFFLASAPATRWSICLSPWCYLTTALAPRFTAVALPCLLVLRGRGLMQRAKTLSSTKKVLSRLIGQILVPQMVFGRWF